MEFHFRLSRSAFGNVGRHTDRGAAKLGRQTEAFLCRKLCREGIDDGDEFHCVLPNLKPLVGPLCRITNHESPITAVQPMTNSGWSNSTGWPDSQVIASTVPEMSASIWLNIFIASMTPSVSPAFTAWPTATNAGLSGEGEA